MSMIKWTGRSTNGIWKRKEDAHSFIELYNLCVENGTISECDESPYNKALMEKY